MTETAPSPAAENGDLIDRLAGITPGSALDLLRRERPVTHLEAQSCQDAIFGTLETSTLSKAHRHAIALRVATLHEATGLAAVHAEALAKAAEGSLAAAAAANDPAELPADLAAWLTFADRLTLAPVEATKDDLDALRATGASVEDIVAAGQLIGFLSYQARLLAGLDLLSAELAA